MITSGPILLITLTYGVSDFNLKMIFIYYLLQNCACNLTSIGVTLQFLWLNLFYTWLIKKSIGLVIVLISNCVATQWKKSFQIWPAIKKVWPPLYYYRIRENRSSWILGISLLPRVYSIASNCNDDFRKKSIQ